MDVTGPLLFNFFVYFECVLFLVAVLVFAVNRLMPSNKALKLASLALSIPIILLASGQVFYKLTFLEISHLSSYHAADEI